MPRLCGVGLWVRCEMGERVAGGLQCFAFLPSMWDIHADTSPAPFPRCARCCWCAGPGVMGCPGLAAVVELGVHAPT